MVGVCGKLKISPAGSGRRDLGGVSQVVFSWIPLFREMKVRKWQTNDF